MRRFLSTTVAVVVMGWAGIASADSPKLKGDYAFTGSASCLTAINGFDASLRAIPNPPGSPTSGAFSSTFSVEGIRTFNGNGGGTVRGRVVNLIIPPFASGPGASSADIKFDFTYTLDGAGGFDTDLVPGTFVATILTGPGAGLTFDIDTLPFFGLIGKDASVLTLASVVPTIETRTFSNGDVQRRICHRSRVLVKMNPGQGHKD